MAPTTVRSIVSSPADSIWSQTVRSVRHATGGRREQRLLLIVVHVLDQGLEPFAHLAALDLARRRYRLALLLGIQDLGKDSECLDLLDAREADIGPGDLARNQRRDAPVRCEVGEA